MTNLCSKTLPAALIVLPFLCVPALADANNHGYSNTLGRITAVFHARCDELHADLITAEDNADLRSGTPAAKPYADQADAIQEKAKSAGCGWAQ